MIVTETQSTAGRIHATLDAYPTIAAAQQASANADLILARAIERRAQAVTTTNCAAELYPEGHPVRRVAVARYYEAAATVKTAAASAEIARTRVTQIRADHEALLWDYEARTAQREVDGEGEQL